MKTLKDKTGKAERPLTQIPVEYETIYKQVIAYPFDTSKYTSREIRGEEFQKLFNVDLGYGDNDLTPNIPGYIKSRKLITKIKTGSASKNNDRIKQIKSSFKISIQEEEDATKDLLKEINKAHSLLCNKVFIHEKTSAPNFTKILMGKKSNQICELNGLALFQNLICLFVVFVS